MPATPEAAELLDEFTDYAEHQVALYAKTGIDALWGRAAEHAYKIALICACAADTASPVIQPDHARWAIHFVGHHTECLAKQVKERIADSPFEQSLNDFYRAIIAAGERGLTKRDMNRSKPFRSYPPRERGQIIETLISGEQIALREIKTGGRSRRSYVAINTDE